MALIADPNFNEYETFYIALNYLFLLGALKENTAVIFTTQPSGSIGANFMCFTELMRHTG